MRLSYMMAFLFLDPEVGTVLVIPIFQIQLRNSSKHRVQVCDHKKYIINLQFNLFISVFETFFILNAIHCAFLAFLLAIFVATFCWIC